MPKRQNREKIFQAELVKSIEYYYPGSRVDQAQDIVSYQRKATSRKGRPDFICVIERPICNQGGTAPYKTMPVVEFWECKVRKMPKREPFMALEASDFSAEQQEWIDLLNRASAHVYALLLLWDGCNSDSLMYKIPLFLFGGRLRYDWTLSQLRAQHLHGWNIQYDPVKQLWRV